LGDHHSESENVDMKLLWSEDEEVGLILIKNGFDIILECNMNENVIGQRD
jgi:hypothetical protein